MVTACEVCGRELEDEWVCDSCYQDGESDED